MDLILEAILYHKFYPPLLLSSLPLSLTQSLLIPLTLPLSSLPPPLFPPPTWTRGKIYMKVGRIPSTLSFSHMDGKKILKEGQLNPFRRIFDKLVIHSHRNRNDTIIFF